MSFYQGKKESENVVEGLSSDANGEFEVNESSTHSEKRKRKRKRKAAATGILSFAFLRLWPVA